LSELTTELTKAGYDTSRIQQRAEIIAKFQGAKRKRDQLDDGDVEMGSAEDDDGAEGRDDVEEWMDEDEDGDADESSPKKRVKTNSGGVINRREPKSDRQMGGLRDQEVSHLFMAF